MLELFIYMMAIYGITVFVKEMDGPLDIMNKIRLTLLQNKYVGVFFYKLLECYFCVGTWSGVLVYVLHNHLQHILLSEIILWGFGGATISLIGSLLVQKLIRNTND